MFGNIEGMHVDPTVLEVAAVKLFDNNSDYSTTAPIQMLGESTGAETTE